MFRQLIYVIISQILSALSLACCGKYAYDVKLNLHSFVYVISEALGVVTKNTELLHSTVAY